MIWKQMLFLFIFLFLIDNIQCHINCDNPVVNLRFTGIQHNDSSPTRIKRAPQSLRIARHYDNSYNSMANKDSITQTILDPAIAYWQEALSVNNPLTSPLIVDRSCTGTHSYATVGSSRYKICSSSCEASQLCYTTPIPDTYLQKCYTGNPNSYQSSGTTGAGAVNADLLLIITQKTDGCATNVLAYALACELENTLDRPVIGLINICPGKVNTGVGLNMAIATVKHEIVHVLGLTSNLFAFYRSSNGSPLTPRDSSGLPNLGQKTLGSDSVYQYSDNTVKDFMKTFNYPTGPVTTLVSYIVTPTIQAEVRNYFNCPTLEGMMLENYGSSSSALSHFEKLYLQNELMTASISVNAQVSRMTLAVLQDTGWYTPNYGRAENFIFAKSLGCDFATKSCLDYMAAMQTASKPYDPFCNSPVTSSGLYCSSDLKSQLYCNLYDSSSLAAQVPYQYRYFTNKNLVSTDAFSDFCPYVTVYAMVSSGSYIYTGECTDSQNTAVQGSKNDFFNQGFGANSVCIAFPSSFKWYYESCNAQFTPSLQGAGCYQYQCLPNYGLVITVNNFQYQCSSKNQVIDVTSKNTFLIPHGKLVCPDCSSICSAAICGSVTSSLNVQCNNVDRLCPGVISYSVPCSTSMLEFGLLSQITVLILALLSKN